MKTTLLRAIMPLALVFTLISCSSDSTENLVAADPTALTQKYAYSPIELELTAAINDYRASIGLSQLQTIDYVAIKSEEHNEYMIAKNEVNHDFFEERSLAIIQNLGAVKVNENVAYNYSTAQSVLHAWLESPGHKANIEGDFNYIGVSVRENPENGKKYYTNMFIKK